MDDARSRTTLDALGDLFLTGNPSLQADAPSQQEDQASALRALVDEPQAARPMRLAPKPAAAGDEAARERRHFQRWADRRRREELQAEPAEATVHIEAVFLGNLPGFGGPWLNQYAHRLAQQSGPVVVLHVDDEQIDLDLVCSVEQARQLHDVCEAMRSQSDLDLCQTLAALAEPGEPGIGAWIVHLPVPLSSTAVDMAHDMDRWTLLCGADDPAVVGAYRWLKQLLNDAAEPQQRKVGVMVMGAEPQRGQTVSQRLGQAAGSFLQTPVTLLGTQKRMVPVHIETLGSFPGAAADWPNVLAVLKDAHPPLVAPDQPPMTLHFTDGPDEPVDAQTPDFVDEFDAADEQGAEALTESEIAHLDQPAEESPAPESRPLSAADILAHAEAAMNSTPPQASQPQTPPTIETAETTETTETAEVFSPLQADENATPSAAAAAASPEPVAAAPETAAPPELPKSQAATTPEAPSAAVPSPGKEADDAEAAVIPGTPAQAPPAAGDEPDLIALASADGSLTGALALQARCPRQPLTLLALDDAGRLHLLRRHLGSDDELRTATLDLLDARQWVREHLEVLQLTQRQLRFDTDAEPILHLFTDRGRTAARFAATLGESVKIHLLAEVKLADQSTWFCTALN